MVKQKFIISKLLINDGLSCQFKPLMVTDQVSGYTDAEFFNALDIDIYDLGDYRQRLLQENGNDQSIPVTDLFGEYGY